MLNEEPVTIWNTGLPLLILVVLAVMLPRWLVRAETRSQVEVFVAVWASAGLLLLAGGVIMALLYAARGLPLGQTFAQMPLTMTWAFLKISGNAALVWVPILALSWFGLAQRVERLKGDDAARR